MGVAGGQVGPFRRVWRAAAHAGGRCACIGGGGAGGIQWGGQVLVCERRFWLSAHVVGVGGWVAVGLVAW